LSAAEQAHRESQTIRPAVEADLDSVVENLWSVASEGRWIGTEVPFDRVERRRLYQRTMEMPDALLLVAEVDGQVVGQIGVQVARYGVADLGMAIVDGYRNQGIGTALLEAAISWAARSGAHKMSLEVWPHNEGGLALYRKLGFVEEGRKVRHYRRSNGEVWDAILMGRPLP
jgi:ribosomal protein S18 acetylase RimI-like enzyme